MKKVLHYVTAMNRGGEETFIMNVYRQIDKSKVQFGFLYTADDLGAYSSEIFDLGGNAYHVSLNKIRGKFKQIDNYIILKKKLKTLSKDYDFFHIHTQHAMDAYLSSLAAKNAGFQKVIVHSHNSSTIYSIKMHRLFKRLLHTLNITRFACGVEAGKWMYGNDKFTVVNNGIDLNKFVFNSEKRKEIRSKFRWNGKKVIGHVGRFNKQKNHQFLVRAFREYAFTNPDAVLVLVGVGELEDQIKDLVHRLKLDNQVQFLGARSDVNELYQGMDLFVLPSLFEGLPVVLVEVQAADLPCIISDSITKEICILPNLSRLSLEEGAVNWGKKFQEIIEKKISRTSTYTELTKAGYNIVGVANKLQKFYLDS